MTKKRLFINLFANIISFMVSLSISFILTPIIVKKVGDAGYGFIGLANNFVNYASIVTIVINSMASRFITLELTKENKEEANKYFTSVFFMNVIMSAIIFFCSLFLVIYLDKLIDIPSELDFDVKLTFSLAFINLIISLLATVFTIACFAKNRLDLSAIRTIIGNILRAVLLIVLFSFLPAKIYYIILSSLIMSIYLCIENIILTRKLAPELSIKKKYFSKPHLLTLAKSGVWNSVNSLSRTLLTGLDLLIANIFISAEAMGVLSIAKVVPNAIEQLLAVFANTFNPEFLILYSENKKDELVKHIKFSFKLVALLMLVPIAGYIAFGTEFFMLWIPSKSIEEIKQIQILAILSVVPFFISASNYTSFVMDSVTNKLKRPVIATLIMSVLSTATTIILLKTTDLGVYAVAGVSSVYWIIKVCTFNVVNCAVNIKVKWNTFYKTFLRNVSVFGLIIFIFIMLKKLVVVNTWLKLGFFALIFGAIGYIISYFLILDKLDRRQVKNFLKEKILHKKVSDETNS